MNFNLVVAYDNIAKSYFDIFLSQNDAQAIRNRLPVHQRMLQCVRKDIQYYNAGVFSDETGKVQLNAEPVPIDMENAYKFPETVSMSIGEYNDLQKTLGEFQRRVSDLENMVDNPNREDILSVETKPQ